MSINLTSHQELATAQRFQLIVYDLDGTLFDTIPDLLAAANLALADRGYPTADLAQVQKAIGDGARKLIHRLAGLDCPESEIDRIMERFHPHYLRLCCDRSTPREGAIEFLKHRAADFPGRFQAILTNKPQAPTDRLVHHHGMDAWVKRVIGGDTPFGRKPETAGLLELMRWAGAAAERTLIIGDGPADLAVALAAGIRSIRVDGGYGDAAALDALPSTWRADGFPELETRWVWVEPDSDPRIATASH
jgi:phosphoglycolate phosphatase